MTTPSFKQHTFVLILTEKDLVVVNITIPPKWFTKIVLTPRFQSETEDASTCSYEQNVLKTDTQCHLLQGCLFVGDDPETKAKVDWLKWIPLIRVTVFPKYSISLHEVTKAENYGKIRTKTLFKKTWCPTSENKHKVYSYCHHVTKTLTDLEPLIENFKSKEEW